MSSTSQHCRIFHVGYDPMLLRLREMLLIQKGFAVTSVCGNAAARRLLEQEAPFDAFLVGWDTANHEREAIVHWLKQHWPKIPLIAIRDWFQNTIPGADLTASHNTPEEWLAAVQTATRKIGGSDASA
ncbi:MAG TPA: hypothetical protein VJQ54_04785 [Candidatus Sulfotelmatobacter sp.]|nr:hypothetical protein [Candidatus Sulfotelmatobacter sp.]